MKKIILSLASVLAISTATKSQNNDHFSSNTAKSSQTENKSPEQRSQKDAERAAAKLGLDATQKAQWQAASLERINANEPLRAQQQSATNPSEKHKFVSQMKENQKKFDDRVNGFLTADQKVKWEEIKKEKKDSRRGKMSGSGQSPAPN